MAARRRGVRFDLGNGRTGHLRWDIADHVLKAGFLPDTFSTDWTPEGRTAQVIDFPNVMSKFLMLGMPLDQVVACATVNASRAFPVFHDRGTLKPGAPADVAVLELSEGNFDFADNFGDKRAGRQRLLPERYRARWQSRRKTHIARWIQNRRLRYRPGSTLHYLPILIAFFSR